MSAPASQLENSWLSESLLPSIEAKKTDGCISTFVGTKGILANPALLGNQELITAKKRGLVNLVLLWQQGQTIVQRWLQQSLIPPALLQFDLDTSTQKRGLCPLLLNLYWVTGM